MPAAENSPKDSYFNQALWLGIGQLCTFAIAFLTAPVMTRYFDRVEYGTYRQILYVYTSISSLLTMGLPSVFAYFVPRLKAAEQKTLINAINKLFVLIGAVLSLALFLLSDALASWLNNPELATGLKIFSPFPLFTIPAMGVESIYTALKKTKVIAIYQVVSKLLMFLCIILPVILFHTSYRGAIIGWGCASFITFLIAMWLKNRPYVGIDAKHISGLYRQVFNYCLPLTGAFIAGFFCNSSDQFFVSRYYGTSTYAIFITGILTVPIIPMVTESVRNVMLPMLSKSSAEGTMVQAMCTYRNAVKRTALIVIPMLAFCFAFSEDVMVALYGAKYGASSSFFRLQILKDLTTIFPYFAVLAALGLNRLYMNIHIVGAFTIPIAEYAVCKLMLPAEWILVVSLCFTMARIIFVIIYLYRRYNLELLDRNVARYITGIILHCSIITACLLVLRTYLFPKLNVYVSVIGCGITSYLLTVATGRLLKYNYLESIFAVVKRKRA